MQGSMTVEWSSLPCCNTKIAVATLEDIIMWVVWCEFLVRMVGCNSDHVRGGLVANDPCVCEQWLGEFSWLVRECAGVCMCTWLISIFMADQHIYELYAATQQLSIIPITHNDDNGAAPPEVRLPLR